MSLLIQGAEVYAQVPYQRTYASSEIEGANTVFLAVGAGSIASAGAAVDGNLWTKSDLTCNGLLVFSENKWQQLRFAIPFSRSIPVHIKFSTQLPLNVLGNASITLQAYNNTTAVGSTVTLSSGILGLIGGTNMIDYVMPAPGGAGNYDGIRLTLEVGGVIATAVVSIYEAYYNSSPSGNTACNNITDYVYGVTGSAVLSGVNDVTDPQFAVDGNRTTRSRLRANVSILSTVFETALYSSSSKPGDSVRIILQNGASGLLDATLISSNINVDVYNGNTLVTTLANQSSFLKLVLLSGGSSIQQLTFPVTSSFDRVRVSLGQNGLANALSSVYLYEIERIAPNPVPTAIGMTGGFLTTCLNEPISINLANPESGSSYKWFDAQTGGNPVTNNLNSNGTTFTPSNLVVGVHEFFVSVVRPGCSDEASDRQKVSIKIAALPAVSVSASVGICQGVDHCDLNYTLGEGGPKRYSISWSSSELDSIGETTFSTSPIKIPIPQNLVAGTYPGNINVKNDNGCMRSIPFNLIIHPKPGQAIISPQ